MRELPMTYGVEAGMIIPIFYVAKCKYCGERIVGTSEAELREFYREHVRESHPGKEMPGKFEVYEWIPHLPGDGDGW